MHRMFFAAAAKQNGIAIAREIDKPPVRALGMPIKGRHHGAQICRLDADDRKLDPEVLTLDMPHQTPTIERLRPLAAIDPWQAHITRRPMVHSAANPGQLAAS